MPDVRVEGQAPHQGQPSTDYTINSKANGTRTSKTNGTRQIPWPQEAHADLGLVDDGRAVGL
jgi:hypothetical protein